MSIGKPVLHPTTTTTTATTTTTTEAPIPNALELSGTTTENYWKDYQLLGLYNREGNRNGAPYYKRFKDAFLLGEIYFYYAPQGYWMVSNKKSFEENEGFAWLWKESPGKQIIPAIRIHFVAFIFCDWVESGQTSSSRNSRFVHRRSTDNSELNPANIGRFESEENRLRWKEAEQFGGRGKYGELHIANITVIPIIKK